MNRRSFMAGLIASLFGRQYAPISGECEWSTHRQAGQLNKYWNFEPPNIIWTFDPPHYIKPHVIKNGS